MVTTVNTGIATNPGVAQGSYAADQTQFYGLPIPISYGRRMQAGVNLWSGPLRVNGSSRLIDFAVGFGKTGVPAAELLNTDLLRLWIEGILVIDRTSLTGSSVSAGLNFTLYNGAENQLPDPDMIANLGADNTPAFREMVYMVFKDFPLDQYGLFRLPNMRAELSDITSSLAEVQQFTRLTGALDDRQNSSCVDWELMRLYTFAFDTTVLGTPDVPATYITVYDLTTGQMVSQSLVKAENSFDPFFGIGFPAGGFCYPLKGSGRGYLVLKQFNANTDPLVVIDPIAGTVVGHFGEASIALENTADGFVAVYYADGVQLTNDLAIDGSVIPNIHASEILVTGSLFTDLGMLEIDASSALSVYNLGTTLDANIKGIKSGEPLAIDGEPTDASSVAYVATDKLWRVQVNRQYHETVYTTGTQDANGNYNYSITNNISASQFYTPNGGNINYIFVDKPSAEVIVFYTHDDQDFVARVKHPNAGKLFGKISKDVQTDTQVGIVLYEEIALPCALPNGSKPGWDMSDTRANTLGWSGLDVLGHEIFCILNLKTGTFVTYPFTTWRFSGDTVNQVGDINAHSIGSVWSSTGNYLLTYGNVDTFGYGKVYPGRAPDDEYNLSDLLRWYALGAGFAPDQIVVSGIDDLVIGSIIEQQIPFWTMLGDIASLYSFQVFESEGAIKFTRNSVGEALVIAATLEASKDLAWVNNDPASDSRMLLDAKQNAGTLPPSKVILTYLNFNADYSTDTVYSSRTTFPVETTQQGSTQNFAVPLVLTPSEALVRLTKALYNLWTSQDQISFRVPPRLMGLEPADVVKIITDVATYLLMITEDSINADYSSSMLSVPYTIDNTITSLAAETAIHATTSVAGLAYSMTWVFDIEQLYFAGQTSTLVPVLTKVTGLGQFGWTGGSEFFSVNGQDFPRAYRTTLEPAFAGRVVGLPTNPAMAPFIDDVNLMTVTRTHGSGSNLAAISTTDFLNGGNVALYGDTGRWEWIQFRDVTVNDDQSITLGYIMRGLRGSEDAMALHHPSDRLYIPFYYTDLVPVLVDNSSRGSFVFYEAVGDRLNQADEPIIPVTFLGNAGKCFAPATLAAAKSGSDAVLTWNARTRLNDDTLHDSDGNTTLETAELYDVEIIDPGSGLVVRTVTGLTSATYTYTSAQQTTDLGGVLANVTFRVYQINYLGRGFAGQRACDVL